MIFTIYNFIYLLLIKMATRSTIYLTRGRQKLLKMYHHWDWYETGVGKTLFDTFRPDFYENETVWEKELIKMLFKLETIQEGREIEPITTDHGDIEYLYFVDLNTRKITYFKGWYWEEELEKGKEIELTRDLLNKLELQELKRAYEKD